MTYTPRPWEIDDATMDDEEALIRTPGEWTTIAKVTGVENAHIIAEAPEMFEALLVLGEGLRTHIDNPLTSWLLERGLTSRYITSLVQRVEGKI